MTTHQDTLTDPATTVRHVLVDALVRGAGLHPGRVAVIDDDVRTSYGQLYEHALRAAGALRSLGIGAEDRVAYLGTNSVDQLALTGGAAMLGAVAVPVNWRLSGREVAHVLADMGARMVVAQPAMTALAHAGLPALGGAASAYVIGDAVPGLDDYRELLAAAQPITESELAETGDRVAVQLYTSGTSGRPKGVLLGNRGMRATMQRLADVWRLDPDAVIMPILPWFHVGGIGAACGALCAGAAVVVQNALDGARILDAIARYRVSTIVLAPTMLQRMLEIPQSRTTDLSSLRLISYGGSPITQRLLRQVLELLDCDVVQVYGLTESWGTVTLLDDAAHRDPDNVRRLQSAGKPLPGTVLKLVDPASGDTVPAGEVGEVWVRFTGNMTGYYNAADATAEVLRPDGWLRTRDLGYQDDEGYLYLCDRLGDMIVSGGENIYPSEVEDVLSSHPAVSEVAVVGVPDETWGETPTAFVVTAPGSVVRLDELVGFAREHIAHYKCPTSVHFVDALPRNPSGKVLRRELRSRITTEGNRS